MTLSRPSAMRAHSEQAHRIVQPPRPVVHLPTLSGVLRCQNNRCMRTYLGAKLRPGDVVFPKCWQDRCGAEWWALKLGVGYSIPQLAKEFGSFALEIADRYSIPMRIEDGPLFFQLALTHHEAELYQRDRRIALSMFRALDLIPRAVA